jgi:hypothetical protein
VREEADGVSVARVKNAVMLENGVKRVLGLGKGWELWTTKS